MAGQGRGIRSAANPGRGRAWTDEEDAIILDICRSGAPNGCTQEAATRIGRTRLAVGLRMHRLGIVDRHRPRSEKQQAFVEAEGARRRGRGKIVGLSEIKARALFEEFRASIVSLRKFGRRVGYHGDGLARVWRRFFPDEYDALTEERSARRDLKYRKGRTFEYLVRDALRARGWWVLRSPQSRSPIDLVAVRKGSVAFVQCKAGGGLSLMEKAQLIEVAQSVGAVPVLADREPDKARGMRLRRIEVAGYSAWTLGMTALVSPALLYYALAEFVSR